MFSREWIEAGVRVILRRAAASGRSITEECSMWRKEAYEKLDESNLEDERLIALSDLMVIQANEAEHRWRNQIGGGILDG